VNSELRAALAAHEGVLHWRDACLAVPDHVVCYAVRAGQVRLLFPGVLVDPAGAGDPATRRRAALCCAGTGSAVSHLSALDAFGLPAGDPAEVHVVTGPGRRMRVAGIRAHRRSGFAATSPDVVIRAGMPVVRLERALLDSWPLLRADAQRAPLLAAVNARMTTPSRIRTLLATSPNLPGRRSLDALLTKLDAGCRSELELWGYDRVFTGPGLRSLRRQVRVRLPAGVVYLDVYDPGTGTNVELDGAKWHASPAQRERDLRRDAALASVGVQVVRYTHERLRTEPDRVRAEVLAILAARRLCGARPSPALDADLD
jgi:very-short-patch-repair endonuclease